MAEELKETDIHMYICLGSKPSQINKIHGFRYGMVWYVHDIVVFSTCAAVRLHMLKHSSS